MIVRLIFCCFVILAFFSNCGPKNRSSFVIHFKIDNAKAKQVVLSTIPSIGEKRVSLDSAQVKEDTQVITFTLPKSEERLYRIQVKGTFINIPLINDADDLFIEVDTRTPENITARNSPATSAIHSFARRQSSLSATAKGYFEARQKLTPGDKAALLLSDKKLDSLLNLQQTLAISFADTVSSPAAFLFVYNTIEFGKDFGALKSFISHASNRFPNHSGIQKLMKETSEYLKIFEEEFEVGDTIPTISLPTTNGAMFSTGSLKGRYYLLQFWSSWCPQCLQYFPFQKKAKETFPVNKFEMVGIAIDSEKDAWRKVIARSGYDSPQIIDTAMWNGPAVNTYKIDSIPFNFLVDPSGKIIAKAIPPDSLITVLKRSVH